MTLCIQKQNVKQFLFDMIVLEEVQLRKHPDHVLLHHPPQLCVLEMLVPGRILSL